MYTFYTTLLSKSDFSFVLLLVTFEPLDLEQSYIPHLKALMCGINAAEAQRCDCMFTFCYAYPKMGVLLHKMANASHSSSGTVYVQWRPFENQQSPVYVVKWLFSRRNNMR